MTYREVAKLSTKLYLLNALAKKHFDILHFNLSFTLNNTVIYTVLYLLIIYTVILIIKYLSIDVKLCHLVANVMLITSTQVY